MENVFNWRRGICILGITLLMGGITYFFCAYKNYLIDDWICFGFFDFLFLIILTYELVYSRSNGLLSNNRNTNYLKVFLGFLLCSLITVGCAFLPAFAKPVMIFSLIMYSVSNEMVAIACGVYFSIVLIFSVGGDYYELIEMTLLVLFGTILSRALMDKGKRIFSCMTIFTTSICIPAIFNYWSYRKFPSDVILYNAIIGVVTVIAAYLCAILLRKGTLSEVDNVLIDIMEPDYVEVIGLKNYSTIEYSHSKRSSVLAYKCANAAGLNPNICAAGAFYYRLGKWLGEDNINLGVKRAKKRCFPEALVNILEEYYGENKDISTPESALVHLVDSVVKKMDGINGEVGNSQWNKEIVIFQTLNELSESGIYDKSGLGMNHFLKIRECIIKEVS